MKKVHRIMALGVVLALAGCGAQAHQGPYGGHDAHWYTTHSKQAVAEVKWCDAGSTHRENTQTCNAAYAGMNQKMENDMWGSGHFKSQNFGSSPLSNMQPIS